VRQSLILMMEHSMPGDFARMNYKTFCSSLYSL
jgi:hypothetical protein